MPSIQRLSRFHRALIPIVSVVLLMLAGTARIEAQFNLGTIAGTVVDPSGGAVAGCNVTVVSLTNGNTRTVPTSSSGLFTVASLPADTYEVTVQASGFQKAVARLTVSVDQTVTSDFRLAIGSISEQVQVTEQSTQLQVEKDTHEIAQAFATGDLQDLPANGRSFISVADISAGAGRVSDVPNGPLVTYGTGSAEMVLAGQVIGTTHFLQDGVVNMNLLTATANIVPSIESIQEVSVESSGMSAKFPSPGLVNVISKRGSNAIHGMVYDYLGNDALNATNFFAATKPVQRYNHFGGNLGAPILKNRLFAFFDYSGERSEGANVARANMPTAAQRQGNFGTTTIYDPATFAGGTIGPFPGNTIPSSRISSFATQFLNYYPLANVPVVGGVNYNTNLQTNQHPDTYVGRLDYTLSSKDTLSGQIETMTAGSITPNVISEYDLTGAKSGWNASVQDIHLFSPEIINIARVGYNRAFILIAPTPMGTEDFAKTFGLKNLTLPPDTSVPPVVSITGITGSGYAQYPMGGTQNLYQYADEVNWTLGKHQIFFGGELDRKQFNGIWQQFEGGSYGFNGTFTSNHLTGAALKLGPGMADFLLGIPATAQGAIGHPDAALRSSDIAGYIQDTWKIHPKLTLNLGLRYEFYGPPEDKWGKGSIYNLPGNNTQVGSWQPNYRNFGPRVGFAYSIGNNTVIRSGFGIYYNTEPYQFLSYTVTNPPNYISQTVTANINNPVPVTDVFSANPSLAATSPNTLGLRMPTPYVEQWNFSLQHSFNSKLLATLSYVGNRAHDQTMRYNPNQAVQDVDPTHPTSIQSRRPYPYVGDVLAQYNVANSTYDSMQATLRYRFSTGLSVQANYTWSKALDLSEGGANAPANGLDLNGSYGPANFDRTQTFNASYTYELPVGDGKRFLGNLGWLSKQVVGGWNVSGITSVTTGPPFEVLATDTSNTGADHIQPADRICDGTLPSDQRSIQHWFQTSCFVQPAAGRIGNEGRNVLRGPGATNFDLSAYKRFPFGEKRWVQLKAEFFNAFNHPTFSISAPPPGSGTQAITGATYGQLNYAYPARSIVMSLKLAF